MFGADWQHSKEHQSTIVEDNDDNDAGLIPRAIISLYNQISDSNVHVYCSFLQIYNERIYDLLQDQTKPKALELHESKVDGIYVEGLSEYAVSHHYDCLSLMKRGEKNRIIRSTTMNIKSSRSHTIFQMQIESSKPDIHGSIHRSKLNLCDLAGSEKINNNESIKQLHLIELKNINQSLTTLGKVIQNLTWNIRHKQQLPIPYRESKLTRFLQQSLSGNTITHIIVNVAPGINNLDETHHSLKFAQRARNIQLIVQPNKLQANDQQLVNKLVKEIEYLKSLLNMKRQGLNANDLNFKLIKIQEENQRLKQNVGQVQELQNLIQENRILKTELQKIHSSGYESQSNLSNSPIKYIPTSSRVIRHHSEDSLNNQNETTLNQNTKLGGSFFSSKYSNQPQIKYIHHQQSQQQQSFQLPRVVPRTEVNVRIRGRGNLVQMQRGVVEESDEDMKRETRLQKERKRVIERIKLLERIQMQISSKPKMTNSREKQ